MSEERRNRIIVREESPPSRGERKPIIRRRPLRSKDEINSWTDKVAKNSPLMRLFNSGLGANDEELKNRVLDKVLEELRQVDPTANISDASKVLLTLLLRAHGKEGGR